MESPIGNRRNFRHGNSLSIRSGSSFQLPKTTDSFDLPDSRVRMHVVTEIRVTCEQSPDSETAVSVAFPLENPFAAPRVESSRPPLPEETEVEIPPGEYRIGKHNTLLVSGDVQLPKVCLHTGSNENLVLRKLTVYHSPFLAGVLNFLVCVVIGAISVPIFLLSLAASRHAGHPLGTEFILPALCVPFMFKCMNGLQPLISESFEIRYFEAQAWCEKRDRRRLFSWVVGIAIWLIVFCAVWLCFGSPILLPLTIIYGAMISAAVGPCIKKRKGEVFQLTSRLPLEHLQSSAFANLRD